MCWSYDEVHAGTQGFSPLLRVGEGGFGVVYRASLKNTDCAVKRLKQVGQSPRISWEILKLRRMKSKKCWLARATWWWGHDVASLTVCLCHCRTACWTGSSWRRASTPRWTNCLSESAPFPTIGLLVHAGFSQTFSSAFAVPLKQKRLTKELIHAVLCDLWFLFLLPSFRLSYVFFLLCLLLLPLFLLLLFLQIQTPKHCWSARLQWGTRISVSHLHLHGQQFTGRSAPQCNKTHTNTLTVLAINKTSSSFSSLSPLMWYFFVCTCRKARCSPGLRGWAWSKKHRQRCSSFTAHLGGTER